MAPSQCPHIIVIHSSDEMYGADRILLQVLAALRDTLHADLEVWLPDDVEHGTFPLCEQLSELGYRSSHRPVPVLRRAHTTPRGLLGLVRDTVKTASELRRRQPDLVYLSSSACLLAAPAARVAGIGHRFLHIQERWAGRTAWVLRLLARSTTERICISNYVAETARLHNPSPTVVVNCVDDAATRVEVRPAGGGPELCFVVASRWNRWKGHRTLFEAWEIAGCPGRLTVLGGVPPSGTGSDVHTLRSELVSRPDTVEIVGEVFDAAPHIAASDVLVLPSDEPEPFGLVLIEAFSLGRPVIASHAGGPVEIIEEGRTGWMFERGDAAELADLLGRLTPTDVAAAGTLARAAYENRFRPDRFRRRIAEIFFASLGRSSGSGGVGEGFPGEVEGGLGGVGA